MFYRNQFVALVFIIQLVGCGTGQTKDERSQISDSENLQNIDSKNTTSQFAANASLYSPPVPSDLPDLIGFRGTEWTHEQLPPYRYSADGRVAVAAKSGRGQIRFHLLSPERLKKPFGTSNGTGIVQRDVSKDAPDKIHVKTLNIETSLERFAPGFTTDHISLCDVKQTPRSCGGMDCYDLVAIASLMPEGGHAKGSQPKESRLASFPVTVMISNPKTPDAKISSVELNDREKVTVSEKFALSAIFEPLAAGDGRLLISRIGNSDLSWKDSRGKTGSGNYDVVYSWYSGGAPCDASMWKNFIPITHAPHDYDIRTRYDFARQPFRDGKGDEIEDGTETGISYPWIDRDAKILVFATNGSTLFKSSNKNVTSRFPVRFPDSRQGSAIPADNELESIEEGRGLSRGFAVMGAWTRGRMILMDNMLNRADFGLASSPTAFREVALYKNKKNEDVYIKVGANRDNTAIEGLLGYVGNTTFFESITDRFAFSNKFQQRLARDVTWTVANGLMTDELSFDEFLDHDTVLFADMNAVIGLFENDSKIQYRNGESAPPLLQNTSSGGPAYGELTGNARIEPVSLGGRFGKGVYLQARDTMSFYFDAPLLSDELYLGAFVKPQSRFKEALLFTLPSGGAVRVTGDDLKLTLPQGSERTINLVPRTLLPDTWVHIGFLSEKLSNGKFSLSTFVNGMAMSYDVFVNPPLGFSKGKLIVGGGVSGWFDEIRVAKALPNEEELCNYSYGTLAQLNADIDSNNNWAKRSALYPTFAHARIQASLKNAGESSIGRDTRFVCLINHKDRYGWAPSLPRPNGLSRYLRSTLLMNGQVFHAMKPRPEARYNKFCQSCHFETNPIPGLKRERPLVRLDIVMDEDDRKQPTQPRRIWSGVTPSGALGENPEMSRSFSIYRYLFP